VITLRTGSTDYIVSVASTPDIGVYRSDGSDIGQLLAWERIKTLDYSLGVSALGC